MSLSRRFLPTLLAVFIFFVCCPLGRAQGDQSNVGTKPYAAFHEGDIDRINLFTRSLDIHIPIVNYPQRGGKLQMSWDFVIPTVRFTRSINPQYSQNPNCNSSIPSQTCYLWSIANNTYYKYRGFAEAFTISRHFDPSFFPPSCSFPICYTAGSIIEGDGTTHVLAQISATQAVSTDGSGYLVSPVQWKDSCENVSTNPPNVVIDRNGLRHTFVCPNDTDFETIEDANGNKISVTSTGYTDSMGRTMSGPLGTTTTDFSHCTGPLPIATAQIGTWLGVNGASEAYKICYASIQVNWSNICPPNSAPFCTVANPNITTIQAIQSLVLPNNTSYTFEYTTYDSTNPATNGWGDVKKITYPDGATITYTWASGLTTPADGACSDSVGSIRTNVITSRVVDAQDGRGPQTWTYGSSLSGSGSVTTVTDPTGSQAVHNFGTPDNPSILSCQFYDLKEQYYQGTAATGRLLKTVQTDYSYTNISNIPIFGSTTQEPAFGNIFPIRVTTTLDNGQTTKIEKDYDPGVFSSVSGNYHKFGDVIAEREYDYGTGAPGALLRQTKTTFEWQTNANYNNSHLMNLPATVSVYDGSGVLKSQASYGYDESALASSGVSSSLHDASPTDGVYRGNQTSVSSYLSSGSITCPDGSASGSGSNVVSHATYFDTGTVQTQSDPCHHQTSFAYSLTYAGAYPTQTTNALTQSTSAAYDFNTALVTSSTDRNNLTTNYSYDIMHRPVSILRPDGGQDTFTYQETSQPFNMIVTKSINATKTLTTNYVVDGLGRLGQSQLTSDPQGTVYTTTTYDGLGRISSVTNPYRFGADITTSAGTTSYGYDGLGRKISQTTAPDGSVLSTAYCDSSTLVTDPTGRWRRSRTDGLGRLVEVDEPNSGTAQVAVTGCPGTGEAIWVTSYVYDTLGNLTSVLQNGSHPRSFTYNSFSQLLSSNNPEVGTVSYAYSPDGTIISKTDARNIVTSYQYDSLHRETARSYSNRDPTVSTTYDQTACVGLPACQNIGHRTSMTDGGGSEIWAYQVDKLNSRSVHADQRTTNSSPVNITMTVTSYFDLAGNLTQLHYPAASGRVVNYTYDAADRPSAAIDNTNGFKYATGWQAGSPPGCAATAVCYTPQGAIYGIAFGPTSTFTGFNITNTYNSRLMPLELKASSTAGNAIDITYNYVDPVKGGNAGHVFSITNNLNASRTQSFTYDQLNRITSAGTSATTGTYCWGYQYSYDAWANLLSQAGWTPTYSACSQGSLAPITADGSNHISAFGYDASGNASGDGMYTYAWDAESQLKSAAGVTYLYDGDGRRVSKSTNKLYWYGPSGEIIAETDATGHKLNDYIFFAGKHIGTQSSSGVGSFYVEDSLGSSRVLTTTGGVVCYDADFTPYGGEQAYTNSCPQNYKFEGKERDTETGNDDFGARYYTNRFGRWLSADWSNVPVAVPYANLSNPQTLNLYSMVADDPESFADLDGHQSLAGADPLRPGGKTNEDCQAALETPKCTEDRQKIDQRNATMQQQATNAGQFIWDEVTGIGKEAANTVIGLTNLVDDGINAVLGTSLQTSEFSASSPGEKRAMLGTSVALIFLPGEGEVKAGETLSRLGTSRESAARLARKAAEAEEKIGIHGVSATASEVVGSVSRAARSTVESAFKVHNTPSGADTLHRTIELAKPVTKVIADTFNSVFGRTP